MPITRSSAQRSKYLEEYYRDLSREESDGPLKNGKMMLDLLRMINQLFKETQLYGLTSHHRLVIQRGDNWDSPWYIIVNAVGNEYELKFLLPEYKQPWENARVIGGAKTLAEIRRKLIIAMHECEAWPDSEELKDLVRGLNEE